MFAELYNAGYFYLFDHDDVLFILHTFRESFSEAKVVRKVYLPITLVSDLSGTLSRLVTQNVDVLGAILRKGLLWGVVMGHIPRTYSDKRTRSTVRSSYTAIHGMTSNHEDLEINRRSIDHTLKKSQNIL
jgi:hypothetical protein